MILHWLRRFWEELEWTLQSSRFTLWEEPLVQPPQRKGFLSKTFSVQLTGVPTLHSEGFITNPHIRVTMLRPYFSHTMHANDRALDFVPYSVNGLCANGHCTIFAIGLCAMILIGLCAGFVNGLCAILLMDFVLSDLVPISWNVHI